MNIKSFKKLKLPDTPGVYFFLKNKEILYIGKATSLRDRTKSYLGKDLIHTRGPLILDMVFKADKLKWTVSDSVLEALILEANLIKKHQPYYNTREKDDKSFNFVCVTAEKLPKIVLKRGHNLDRTNFKIVFGPYPNAMQLREALKIIRKVFPFLDDKSKNYVEFYRQINLAPDINDRKLYLQNIHNIKLFFSGKKQQIFKNLKKEMKEYAKIREFERAGEIKRQMFALKHINDVALLKNESKNEREPGTFRIEAYDIAHMSGKNMVGVMTVVENNEAVKSQYRKFKVRTQNNTNDTGALRELLSRRFNHPEWAYPQLLVVDGGVAQLNAAQSVLQGLKLNIPVVSVLKDEKHKPKDILGDKNIAFIYKQSILLSNSEAHRFGITYHKNLRGRNFLPDLKKKNK